MGDETRVQMKEMQKGAEALGGIAERYLIRFLGPLGRRIAQSSKAGRLMALAGVVTVIVSGILIYINSLWFGTSVARRGIKTVTIQYQMEGYGIYFVIGLALFIIGLMQKKTR